MQPRVCVVCSFLQLLNTAPQFWHTVLYSSMSVIIIHFFPPTQCEEVLVSTYCGPVSVVDEWEHALASIEKISSSPVLNAVEACTLYSAYTDILAAIASAAAAEISFVMKFFILNSPVIIFCLDNALIKILTQSNQHVKRFFNNFYLFHLNNVKPVKIIQISQ